MRQSVEDTSKTIGKERNLYLLEYGYDNMNNISGFINMVGKKAYKHSYVYTDDNLLASYTMPSEKTVSYTYDDLNRLKQYQINTDTPLTVAYEYQASDRNTNGSSIYQTTKVAQETAGKKGSQYTYDTKGNITSISEKDQNGSYTLINSYQYDELNQLVREDDINQSKTKVYTYDLGGNIISIKEYGYTAPGVEPTSLLNTITYGYGDADWKDKLTSYNGQAITYDEIGNPTSYNGYTFGWDNGRELSSLSGNGITATYTYDADGLRATKMVNGVKTTYEYVGDKLVYEKKGNTELHYFYDTNGILEGIQTVDSVGTVATYYIVTNTRGDVIQIYDAAGALEVVYTYDSWGKVLSIKDAVGNDITSDTNIGKLNSFRYRGYYYDEETGLYYLQSRYYSPEWNRFLNADDIIQKNKLLGVNLYAYCGNDAINYSDPNGHIYIYPIPDKTIEYLPFPYSGKPTYNDQLGDILARGLNKISSYYKALVWNATMIFTASMAKVTVDIKGAENTIKTPSSNPEDFTKLKGNQGYKDKDGNTWKKDQLHKDHWDISNKKGKKIREVDYDGNEIWPNGPKNKNKSPK